MSMERAFSERSQLGVMIVDPQVADYGSGDSWNFTARVMQLDCDEEQTLGPEAARSPWQRPFVLSLRMLDPRFYKEPIRTLGSGTGTRTLTNDGNAPSDPSFTVATTGAVTITNNTVDGRKLRFIGVPSGDLVVDFKGRTATIDGDDAIPYLQSDSDWWDEGVPGLKPGDNSINVSGGQAWSASWYDASW